MASTFSEFVLLCFVACQESALRLWHYRRPDAVLPPYHRGLWLRTPDEPFRPPVTNLRKHNQRGLRLSTQ